MKSLLLLAFLASASLWAKDQIIDLGKLEVQGKQRGPEVQVIDSNRLGEEAAQQMMRWQLKSLEQELLRHEPPPAAETGETR